ncbi:MAG TPA: hypothetical protein QGF58_19595 [Myxococcota bacterium]|nr:hypothetical protein [Myxococcota bacterium]
MLAEGHLFETPFLNAPGGANLLDVMLVPALLMSPVAFALGPVAAANLWILLSFLLIGAATYRLAVELTGSRLGATFAGLFAQSAPYLYGYALESGVHERLTVWVFPLLVLGLLKAARDGSWRWGLGAAVAVAVTTAGCQVYGVFCVVVLLLSFPIWALRGRQQTHWIPLAATLLAVCVGLIAVYALVHAAATDPWSASIQPGRTELSLGLRHTPDVATFATLLDPVTVSRDMGTTLVGDRLHKLVYLGWIPLLAGLAGAWAGRFDVRVVVAVGVLMALLATGSTLGGVGVPNPLFALFSAFVPTYGAIPPVWQQVGAFGPLAAVGVAALLARWPRWWLAAGLLVGWTIERGLSLPVPLLVGTAPASVPGLYDLVDGPLVEVPRVRDGRALAPGAIFLAQTSHEQPLPVAINLGSTAFDGMREVMLGVSESWPDTISCIEGHGFAWLAYHETWVAPHVDAEDELVELEETLGPPVASGDGIHLFRLEPDPRLKVQRTSPGRIYRNAPELGLRPGVCPGM